MKASVVYHMWQLAARGCGRGKYLRNRRILERRIALKETRCVRRTAGPAADTRREAAGQ